MTIIWPLILYLLNYKIKRMKLKMFSSQKVEIDWEYSSIWQQKLTCFNTMFSPTKTCFKGNLVHDTRSYITIQIMYNTITKVCRYTILRRWLCNQLNKLAIKLYYLSFNILNTSQYCIIHLDIAAFFLI